MKKRLLFVVILLAVIAMMVGVLPMLVQARVGGVVRREAGAIFEGHFDYRSVNVSLLRHFPHASVELREVAMMGVGRFRGDTIATAERVSMVVGIRSLLKGEYEISKVALLRPTLRLHKFAGGAENWHLLRDSIVEMAPSTELPPVRFALGEVRIKEGGVCYVDDSTNMRYNSTGLNVQLRGDLSAPRANLDLHLRARQLNLVSGGVTLLSRADARMDAVLDVNFATHRVMFKENKLILNALKLSLGGWVDLAKQGSVTMDLRADCSRVQFKEVLSMFPAFYRRDFNNLAASGDVTLTAWARGTANESHLPAFEVKLDLRNGRFQYSSLPKAVTDLRITARAVNDGGTFDNTLLDISEFSMKMAGNPIRGSLMASHPMSNLRVEASVAGRLDMDALRKVYPLQKDAPLSGVVTADVRLAASLSDVDLQRYDAIRASGVFVVEDFAVRMAGLPPVHIRRAAASVSPAGLTFGELAMKVGVSDLTANGQLTNYMGYMLDGKPLGGRMYVKSELLDLTEIMIAAEGEGADTTRLPALIVPGNLSLGLSMDVREVRLDKMTLNNFAGGLQISGGTIVLDRLTMRAFGGGVLASGSYSTALDPRCPDLRLTLDMVGGSFSRTAEQLGVVRRLTPLFAMAEGSYSLTLNLAAVLDRYMQVDLEQLHAQGEIRSPRVQFPPVEFFSRLAAALRVNKLRMPDVRDLSIRFGIAEGCIATEPFDFRTEGVQLTFWGNMGLDRQLDYSVQALLPAASESIPMQIRGTFNAPQIMLEKNIVK